MLVYLQNWQNTFEYLKIIQEIFPKAKLWILFVLRF